MKIGLLAREITKLSVVSSVSMFLGGIVLAVVPKNVSVVYKVASVIATSVIGNFVGDKLSDYVDETCDSIEENTKKFDELINAFDKINNELTVKEESGA